MKTSEIYELYGDVPLKFCHCDEYTFMFQKVIKPGVILRAYVGGNCEKIYREIISKQKPITLKEELHYYARMQENENDIWEEDYVEAIRGKRYAR
jgi:hypothetical protein